VRPRRRRSRAALVARVDSREAALHQLVRAHLDVETKLIVDVSLDAISRPNGQRDISPKLLEVRHRVIGYGRPTPPTELGEKFAPRRRAVNTRFVN
jgi:hypothetical protein